MVKQFLKNFVIVLSIFVGAAAIIFGIGFVFSTLGNFAGSITLIILFAAAVAAFATSIQRL